MSGVYPRIVAMTMVVLSAGAVVSCRDRKETVGAELEDAGFKVTPEDWFRACREGNVEVLKKFLSAGFVVGTLDEAGDTALHAAAAGGSEEAADFLLRRGIPIDVKGAKGRTPLMSAVVAGKSPMVGWLLRQGADPMAKDDEGFKALMVAVREGSSGAVEQIAAYDREDLDNALLLAALLGRADVIDSLTNYGASVYARMEDGRTPLMVAAENGHVEAVKLLLDIGASRYTTDAEGRTAAALAEGAGHPEIAAIINREPLPDELALEKPEEISAAMDAAVDAAAGNAGPEVSRPEGGAGAAEVDGDVAKGSRKASVPIEGAVLGGAGKVPADETVAKGDGPRVIMRYYREADVPVEVTKIQGDTAVLRISGTGSREVSVKEGEDIPGSRLYVVKLRKRMEDSKLGEGKLMEVSVVEVGDRKTGEKREWISGRVSTAHDPVALVEDAATGQRYTAKPGQRFSTADGGEFLISDVRPNQIVIQDIASGEVRTIPLRGPRG